MTLVVLLLLLLAFVGALIAYQRAAYRADDLERERDRAVARADRWRRDDVVTHNCLSVHLISEAELFASVPRDQLIDVLGGRWRSGAHRPANRRKRATR